MNKKRSKTITLILVIMIFGLIGTIFYITNILLTPDAAKSKIAAHKSKAADITYSKDVDLGEQKECPDDVMECPNGSFVTRIPPSCEFAACPTDDNKPPEASPTPENVILPIPSLEPSPPAVVNPTIQPSPTDRILADSSSASQESSESTYNSAAYSDTSSSPTVTPMTSLPQTGLVNNSIIVFGLSSLLLFFAFLF